MKKTISFLFLNVFFAFLNSSFGQTLIPFKGDNGWYGFVNDKNKVIIRPRYDDVLDFYDGMAPVKLSGKWGFIDKSGQVTVPCKYEEVFPFYEGFAKVKLNGKSGFVNRAGNLVVPCKYDDSFNFYEDFARVSLNGKWGFVDKIGNLIVPCIYDNAFNFSDGFAKVKCNGKTGLVDNMGNLAVPCKYDDIFSFYDDIATVKLNDKYGFVDKKGNTVAPCKFDEVFNFYQGSAPVKLNHKWGLINKKGNFLVPQKYQNAALAYEAYFPYFAQNKFKDRIEKWQKKGEFEKTADYQIRVNEKTRKEFISKLSKEIESDFLENFKRNSASDFFMKNYDADNECFSFQSHFFGEFVLKVPLKDAPIFKKSFNFDVENSTLTFVSEDFVPGFLQIAFSSNGKIYRSVKNNNVAYPVPSISYKLPPLNSTTQSEVYQKTASENVASVSNLKSDVDINIPTTYLKNENTFVVIIANENYQREADVEFALNDGRIFKQYCEKVIGIPSQNIKIIENATFGNMRLEINWLANVLKAHKGSAKAIFYYSGHGIPNESSREAFILPTDGSSKDFNTGYSLDLLYKQLGEAGGKQVTYFIDACFSGAKRDDSNLIAARSTSIKPKEGTITGNGVVFCAASADETAFAYKEKGHGMFTYFLLKKLQDSKGKATYGEIADYINDKIEKTSIIINSKSQKPSIRSSYEVENSWENWVL